MRKQPCDANDTGRVRKHARPDDSTATARSFFVKNQDLWGGLEHMKGHVSMSHALLDILGCSVIVLRDVFPFLA